MTILLQKALGDGYNINIRGSVGEDNLFPYAEGIGEFNTIDFTHLTKKVHARLARKLTQIISDLV